MQGYEKLKNDFLESEGIIRTRSGCGEKNLFDK
jgi:hypothetical protein